MIRTYLRCSRKLSSHWPSLRKFLENSLNRTHAKSLLENDYVDGTYFECSFMYLILFQPEYFQILFFLGERTKSALMLSKTYERFIKHISELPELATSLKSHLFLTLQIVSLFKDISI